MPSQSPSVTALPEGEPGRIPLKLLQHRFKNCLDRADSSLPQRAFQSGAVQEGQEIGIPPSSDSVRTAQDPHPCSLLQLIQLHRRVVADHIAEHVHGVCIEMGHVHKLPPVVAHAVKAEVQRDLLVQRVQSSADSALPVRPYICRSKLAYAPLLHVIAKAVRHFCPGQVFPAVAQAQILHARGEEFRHVHPGGAAVAGIVIAEVAKLMGKNQLCRRPSAWRS